MFTYKEKTKRERGEGAHIRAEAKTATIVVNQSAANWYNYRDSRGENPELPRGKREMHAHTHSHSH